MSLENPAVFFAWINAIYQLVFASYALSRLRGYVRRALRRQRHGKGDSR